ncbi:MAG: GGDEF domain-containing protein [Planctomycetia bacterium]|nr:GGDEF domain-containing protein [Planctomycetia bacterium]
MLSTSTILLLCGISAFQVTIGLCVGWWLRSARRTRTNTSEVLSRRLTEALGKLQNIADDMGHGAFHHAEQVEAVGRRLDTVAEDDVEELHQALVDGMTEIVTANTHLQTQLHEAETKLEEQSRQIETQLSESRLDLLTGIADRRAFDEELERRLAERRRRPAPLSVILIDIDRLKQINDRRGAPIGDAVLRDVARVLEATMREMDFVARYGDDELAVVLPSTTLREARRAAQRALESVAKHTFEYDHEQVTVTISLGLAEMQPDDDAASLVRRADEALYLSKAAGRNCGHFHTGADFLSLDSPRLLDQAMEFESFDATGARAIDPVAKASADCTTDSLQKAESLVAAARNESEKIARAGKRAAEPDDALTNLPTAGTFSHELRRRIHRSRLEHRSSALILIDVDRLTAINAGVGRDGGDLVLRRTADVLRSICRERDYLARYHHGQFALLLNDATAVDGARTAEHIRAVMHESSLERGFKHVDATVSCGVAEVGPHDRSVSVVMHAGVALAAAKASGRDCTFVHDGHTAEPVDLAPQGNGAQPTR